MQPNALSLQTDLPAQPGEDLEDTSLDMQDPHPTSPDSAVRQRDAPCKTSHPASSLQSPGCSSPSAAVEMGFF